MSISADNLATRVILVPYGVLGQQLTRAGTLLMRGTDPREHEDLVITDPAGMHHIQGSGPAGAGGAAGAIYQWLGIAADREFPASVREGIQAVGQAQYHEYRCVHSGAPLHVIHAVGPDLRQGSRTSREAEHELAQAYLNILREFLARPLRGLRLLPVSSGIFAGAWGPRLAGLTFASVSAAGALLTAEERAALQGRQLLLCIFAEEEWSLFTAAGFGQA